LRDLDAFEHVLNRQFAHSLVKMAQAAEAVTIVLKEVRVHRADTQAKSIRVLFHGLPIVFPVPRNVNGNAGADAGDLVDLSRICQLLAQSPGRSRPVKYLEARA